MSVDTHTHLNFEAFSSDWRVVVERAVQAGVEKMVVVGTDVESSKKAVEMAEKHEALFAAVGVHPHHARAYYQQHVNKDAAEQLIDLSRESEATKGLDGDFSRQMRIDLEIIRELAQHARVVGIGELGLDYHVYQNTKYEIKGTNEEWEAIKSVQKELLSNQIQMAQEVNKPLILHSREAGADVMAVMDELKIIGQVSGVFHCFEGSKQYARRILEAGFYISFTGNLTYAFDRAEVAKEVPLERLLLETDCPYMTPHPFRGQRNEPTYVKIVAEHHAKTRGIDINEVIEQTSVNARELLGL